MADRVICVAKASRKATDAKPCGIELKAVDTGIPSGPKWGHVAPVRWTHWAIPKVVS